VPPEGFVVFSSNHDQIGNRALGDRLPLELRGLAAMCALFAPFTPLVFQGEEYGEDAPFRFFADHIDEDIAEATRKGRREEFASFATFAGEDVPDPQAIETFERSKLTRVADPAVVALYRDLLALRRDLPAGDVDDVACDAAGPWLRVTRGPWILACNFGEAPVSVPVTAATVVLATSGEAHLRDGVVDLPPMSGVVART
jgi:maltooligosyltrehalose trehalohydrolase